MVWSKCYEGSEPQVHHLWNKCNINPQRGWGKKKEIVYVNCLTGYVAIVSTSKSVAIEIICNDDHNWVSASIFRKNFMNTVEFVLDTKRWHMVHDKFIFV